MKLKAISFFFIVFSSQWNSSGCVKHTLILQLEWMRVVPLYRKNVAHSRPACCKRFSSLLYAILPIESFFFVALPSHIVRIMSAYRELRDTDSALALCMHVIFSLCSVFSFHYQHSAICVQQHDIFLLVIYCFCIQWASFAMSLTSDTI